MNSLAILLAPLALMLPSLAGPFDARISPVQPHGDSSAQAAAEDPRSELGFQPSPAAPFRVLEQARKPILRGQVRIQQRVIIRISPSSAATRRRILASLPKRQLRTSFAEVRHGDCIEVGEIAGVQTTGDNRLLLFMNDRKVLTASLDESCTARAFYSGFYVERSDDGKICVSREKLQSRAGASCQISEINRLVAVRN